MKKFFANKKYNIIFGGAVALIAIVTIITIVLINNNTANNKAQGKETQTENQTVTDESIISQETSEELTTTAPVNPSSLPYLVKVNRALNCVTVYSKDANSEFTVPVIAFACSTGRSGHETPLGTFRTSGKSLWCYMVDGTWSQYAYRINGGIMFHAVPCFGKSKDSMETEEFNKLGTHASLGCVRLNVIDAKWIYENCPSGTTVIIYDDATSPGPLGKPGTITIPAGHPLGGWDPTDPDSLSPWHSYTVAINSTDIITLPVGSTPEVLLSKTSVIDSLGNDLTSKLTIEGTYDLNTPGTYSINLVLNWLPSASKTISLIVNSPEVTTESPTQPTTEDPIT